MKLGKKPAVDRPTDLRLKDYKSTASIPVPNYLGFVHVFAGQWAMLGNDNYGDCVWAGADHETQLLNWIGFGAHRSVVEPQVSFTDQNALSDYSQVTGFRTNDPNTDQGTDVGQALSFRKHTGVVDAGGVRHKIGAYVRVPLGNMALLHEALYLGEAVGLGFQFPDSAMDQFNNGEPWTPVAGASIDGGHYVPIIAAEPGWLYIVSWGQTHKMSEAFYNEYADEAYMILSVEGLYRRRRTDYAGYNWSQLIVDASAIGSVQ